MSRNVDTPVLLFPMKVETRFIEQELFLRAMPDEAFLRSHDERITPKEEEALLYFIGETDLEEKWERLVADFGAYRAGYLVHLVEDYVGKSIETVKRFLNGLAKKKENEETRFYFEGMPNQLKVFVFRSNSLDPKEFNSEFSIDNELNVFGEDDEWISDFSQAERKGLALKIKLADVGADDYIERIIVVGFYENPTQVKDKKNSLEKLLENHLYTEGLAFLDYGTPTNNFSNQKSGFSIQEEYSARENLHFINKNVFTKNKEITEIEHGRKLADALGVSSATFQHVKNTSKTISKLDYAIKKASWFALGGQSLQMLLGGSLSSEDQAFIWEHFSEYVHNEGPLGTLKIGDQPYGVLPVTGIKKITKADKADKQDTLRLKNAFLFFSKLFADCLKIINPLPAIHKEIENLVDNDKAIKTLNLKEDIKKEIYYKTYYWLHGLDENKEQKNDLNFITINKTTKANLGKKINGIISSKEIDKSKIVWVADLVEKISAIIGDYKESRVNRIEDAQETFDEILEILSLQPHSSKPQITELIYQKISSRISENARTIPSKPSPFSTLPLGQVYDLLEGKAPYKTLKNEIDKRFEKLFALVGELILPDGTQNLNVFKEKIGYPEILSFEEHKEAISIEKNIELPDAAIPIAISLEKTDGEKSDLEHFEYFLAQLKDSKRGSVLRYEGKPSIMTDYFFRGYSNAMKLWHRIVYFQPSTKVLQIYKTFKVEKVDKGDSEEEIKIDVGSDVAKDEPVLHIIDPISSNKIEILAPFSGVIKKLYFDDEEITNREIHAGQALYRIINEEKATEINETFAELGDAIITELKKLDKEQAIVNQETAIQQVLDLNSYRLDAWITSLATRRLEVQRKIKSQGIYFGAYGVVEHLRRDTDAQVEVIEGKYEDKITIHDGGIIHCPTPAQSMTATIFKNSFMSNQGDREDANPYTLNLSSDRIQKAKKLMQGMREDQEIEALLGYQLERFLHEDRKDELIYTLRDDFPFEVDIAQSEVNTDGVGFKRLGVINGLALFRAADRIDNLPALKQELEALKTKSNRPEITEDKKNKLQAITNQLSQEIEESTALAIKGYYTKVLPYVKRLGDLLDANLDTLFYEAGYQLFNGNIAQSAAAMDAAKGKLDPPIPEAIKTRIPGKGLNHELMMLFPKEATNKNNLKAFIEPRIDAWLVEQLGNLENIVCIVELYEKEAEVIDSNFAHSIAVPLASLLLSHSDLLYLSDQPLKDGAGELELMVWKVAKPAFEKQSINVTDFKYLITTKSEDPNKTEEENKKEDKRPLSEVLEVFQYTLHLLGKSGKIKADSLLMSGLDESTAIISLKTELEAIKVRIKTKLDKLKDELLPKASDNIKELAQFDLAEAKRAFLTDAAIDLEKLDQEATKKINNAGSFLKDFDDTLVLINLETYTTLFDLLHQAAKTLIGPAFILLQPSIIGANQNKQLKAGQQAIYSGKNTDAKSKQRRIQTWIQGLAQVQQEVEVFEDWQMVVTAWNEAATTYEYSIVQNYADLPWAALSLDEMTNEKYQSGTSSLVLYQKVERGNEQETEEKKNNQVVVYGLSIVSFAEHIPDAEVTTGLSFHYNAPNNEPPQALLLAVSPKTGDNTNWQASDLAEIIGDTIDLAKIRMIDPELMQERYYPILPMTNWFHIPTVN